MNLIHDRMRLLVLSAAAVALLLTSCANMLNFGPAISELTTTTEFVYAYKPAEKTNVFYIDSAQICASAKLSGAHRDTLIEANWVYVQGEMAKEANPVVGASKVHCDTDCDFGFTLPPPPGGFISGEYKIDLSIDGHHKAAYPFYIQRDRSGPIPQITSFEARPINLAEGQPVALSWQVSNASRVDIEPAPGQVKPAGKFNLNPTVDTTYTLWAVNRSGTSSRSLTVNVARLIKERADLVVTEFWNTGNILFYRVKNIGDLASPGSQSYLYKNDILVSQDYVAPLDPGVNRVESFASYHFSPRFPSVTGGGVAEATTDAVTMRVCLNADSAFPESGGDNNCTEQNFGPLLNVDLYRYAATAQWQSSTGALNWPMLRDSSGGWAQVASAQMDGGESFPDSIIMTPPAASVSWMQARIGIPQGYPVVLQPFYIPHKSKLSAKVGLTRDAPASANVKFILGTAQGSDTTYYPPVTINSNGKLEKYEVDLSKLAGKQVQFILRVESRGPLQQGSAVWIDPSLTQER